jgi:hypothetical protein
VAAGLDAVLAILSLVPTCYRMYEQASVPASAERTQAYLAETANITLVFGRLASAGVVMSNDPASKASLAKVMTVLVMLYGGLEIAQVIAEAVHPHAASEKELQPTPSREPATID